MEDRQPTPPESTPATSIIATFNPSDSVVAPLDRAETPLIVPILRSVLTLFGNVPSPPILAKYFMVGMNFAKQIGLNGSKFHPGIEYITTSSAIERTPGRYKDNIPIILAVRIEYVSVCMST